MALHRISYKLYTLQFTAALMASYRYVSCPISTSNFTLKNRNGSTVLWKAQPHLQWPCQSCGKNKVSFKTFCQVPQKKSKNPSLYILYNFSIQTMHRKKTVSKTYWNSGKMHCYHLVTTKTNHEHKPPQYYFAYSVVMRMLHHFPSYFGLTTVVTALL